MRLTRRRGMGKTRMREQLNCFKGNGNEGKVTFAAHLVQC